MGEVKTKLTIHQRAMLRAIKTGPQLVPYGDTVASSLLLSGLAQRVTAFGKLKITEAGLRALSTGGQP